MITIKERRTLQIKTGGIQMKLLRFRYLLLAVIISSLCFVNAAFANDEKYPSDILKFQVAASAGGGLDIVSRSFTPQWEKYLETKFEYIYVDTGNTYLMGLNDITSLDDDEYGVMIGLPEAMLGMFAFQKTPYSLEDIAWIGNVYTDANCIMVRIDDDRFNTTSDLIKYAREGDNPIIISTPQALTPANITARIFVKESGIKANVVTYSGGSAARTDLIGGHVDISIGGISTAIGISDQVKVIGIFGTNNPVKDIWDCQLVSDFAKDFTMPDLTYHCSIWTTKKIKDAHPAIYNLLVKTYQQALTASESQASLQKAKQDRFIEYFGPEETEAQAKNFMKVLNDYSDILDPTKQ